MDYKVGSDQGALPQDHEDQMQLGIRIITSSFQNKVHSVEQEIRALRMSNEEQRANVTALQKKNSALEVDLVESHQRSQQLAEENKELFKTVGALRKQTARLESLKAAVMTSIQDDHQAQADLGDTRALMSEDYLREATPLTTRDIDGIPQARHTENSHQDAHRFGGGFSGTQEFSGHGLSAPLGAPAPVAPAAQGAPAGSASSVVDGKQFFRQARSQLSYEAFNMFLANIKRMNNQQQTREETLEEARRIFGTELHSLYQDFEALLNRSGM